MCVIAANICANQLLKEDSIYSFFCDGDGKYCFKKAFNFCDCGGDGDSKINIDDSITIKTCSILDDIQLRHLNQT